MVSAVQMLDGAELGALRAVARAAGRRAPGALWLPAHPDDESLLVAELSASWDSFEWFALGTWYATNSSLNPPSGFADRYPGMVREVVAESDMKTPRGLRVRAEWCAVHSESVEILGFMAATRRSRGKGMCLTLLPPGTSPRNWYALSMGIVGRAVLAVEAESGVPLEEIHQSVAWRYLVECSSVGYASIVPLDHHPWGGCVVVADKGRLVDLALQLPKRVRGLGQVAWEEVVRNGGGLAL